MKKHNKTMEKRGQVSVFVIIGVIILAVAILVSIFFPQIQNTLGFGEENPGAFLQSCLEEEISETVKLISNQGGAYESQHSYRYLGEEIEYLCYTQDYFLPCVMQKPLLKKYIQSEIEQGIGDKVSSCIEELQESFSSIGYSVSDLGEEFSVEILPNEIVTNIPGSISLNREEEVQTYDELRVVTNSNLYELIYVADSIINWEAEYGDSETTIYMNFYRDLKVEKIKQGEGTTIYILTDLDSEEVFKFASRSVVLPPGYGASEL